MRDEKITLFLNCNVACFVSKEIFNSNLIIAQNMRVKIAIIVVSFCLLQQELFSQAVGMTKNEITRFHILRIDTKTKVGNWESLSSVYYDKKGNEAMSVNEDSNYRYIVYYEFRDTLLVKLTEVQYRDGKLADSLVNKFSYKFDSKGRITENSLLKASGEISIHKIIYNESGQYDTTFRYQSSETRSGIKMTECCRWVYQNDKVYSYCYDSLGWNSPNIKIMEIENSDTLIKSYTKECKIAGKEMKDCKGYFTRLYLKEGRQVKFESEDTNYLVEHSYEKDKQGLITGHTIHSKYPGHESMQVDTYEYYFRY